jgi:archaellum biogenesis protein FlaJ (TadC family)
MARDIWISLFLLGAVFFSWPIISIFGYGLAAYLFTAWFIFIALVFLATIFSERKKDEG